MAEPIAMEPRHFVPKLAEVTQHPSPPRASAVEPVGASQSPQAVPQSGSVPAEADTRKPVSVEIAPKTKLVIRYDKEIAGFVYEGVDATTGEVITQYPAERVRRTIAAFRELTGLTVDSKV